MAVYYNIFDSDDWIERYLDDFWNAFIKRMGDTMVILRVFYI